MDLDGVRKEAAVILRTVLGASWGNGTWTDVERRHRVSGHFIVMVIPSALALTDKGS